MKITSRDYGIKIACESHWVLTFSHRSKINKKKTATTTKKEEQEMWKQTKKKNHFKHVTKRFWFLSRIYIQTKVKQTRKKANTPHTTHIHSHTQTNKHIQPQILEQQTETYNKE